MILQNNLFSEAKKNMEVHYIILSLFRIETELENVRKKNIRLAINGWDPLFFNL